MRDIRDIEKKFREADGMSDTDYNNLERTLEEARTSLVKSDRDLTRLTNALVEDGRLADQSAAKRWLRALRK